MMEKKENSINDIKIGNFIFDVFETETGNLGFTVRRTGGKFGDFEGPFVDIFVDKKDVHKVTFG